MKPICHLYLKKKMGILMNAFMKIITITKRATAIAPIATTAITAIHTAIAAMTAIAMKSTIAAMTAIAERRVKAKGTTLNY